MTTQPTPPTPTGQTPPPSHWDPPPPTPAGPAPGVRYAGFGIRALARVLAEVETRAAKIVLVGDAMQLQPIEAGAAFRAVTERVGYVELQGIRRQHEVWAQAASLALARGQAGEALRAYDAHGAVRFRATGAEARALSAPIPTP